MTIINRRNAILGWGVWTVGKAQARRKAKQSLKTEDGSRGKAAAAAASALAAAGGAIWFWRRRSGGDETEK
ncbi:MAG TPA: hypothetical protein VKO41_08425 [Gaiellaceae bacterium]|jgi:hypothetical protein|nr:hypothetical protein [Gaiellaceae bacterium]